MKISKNCSTVSICFFSFLLVCCFAIFFYTGIVTAQSNSAFILEEEYDCDFDSGEWEFTISDKARELKINELLDEEDYEGILQEISDFSQIAAELSEEDIDEYINISLLCCVSLDDLEKASEFIYEATKHKENDPALHFTRGMLDCSCYNYGLAIKSFTHAIELEKEARVLLGLHIHRGCAYASIGKKELAEKDMETVKTILSQQKIEYKTEKNSLEQMEFEIIKKMIDKNFTKMLQIYLDDKTDELRITMIPIPPEVNRATTETEGVSIGVFWELRRSIRFSGR